MIFKRNLDIKNIGGGNSFLLASANLIVVYANPRFLYLSINNKKQCVNNNQIQQRRIKVA
jgi:hypothetical protein